jgi:hypothetical protein
MAATAFQTQYRQEFIAGFEEKQSLLRSAVVTESVIKGNTATFLVADSGGATAVTRGVHGLIPARSDSLTQTSATLAEWHDLVQKTGFNVFGSQGDQRRIMQETSMGVVNRKIDADIIAALDTATIDTGAAATGSVALVAKALGYLGNSEVPITEMDNMFGVITPGMWAYLMQTKEFSSGEYVDVKLYSGSIKKMWRWFGVNWIMHPNLTGVGTASEKCYVFHRTALGHAIDTKGIASPVGYDEEQDYSWARVSVYMGTAKLQNTGIVQVLHDGSAFALS